MKSGASRGRMPRLPIILAGGAAITIVGIVILATTTGAAHAAPVLTNAGPTPTLDPLMVPTAATSSSTPLTSTAISTSSSGIELAVTLSCLTTVVGLIITVITLTGLIRSGYGPFLRALVPGWLRGRLPSRKQTKQEPTLRYNPGPSNPQTGFDIYAESPSSRANLPGPRDWQDRDAPLARQSRGSPSGRNSSRGSSSRASRSRT